MSGEAKQRLVAIEVGEVSMVDRPANEEVFVVTKAMDAPEFKEQITALIRKAEGVLMHPSVAMYATQDAMRDAMYCLIDKLRDPSKLMEATAEVERIKSMLDAAVTLSATVSKSVETFLAEVNKAKADGGEDDKKGGKKMPPWMKAQMKSLIETLKGMSEEDDAPDEQMSKALSTIETVAKGGKAQFSKERMAKLKEATGTMLGMMKDADGSGFEEFMKPYIPAPAAVAAPAATAPVVATAKTEEAPSWFSNAIENLTKKVDDKLAPVTKRLDDMERATATTKTLTEDGMKVEKKAGGESLWKGVV